jgi:hypothetical protein
VKDEDGGAVVTVEVEVLELPGSEVVDIVLRGVGGASELIGGMRDVGG